MSDALVLLDELKQAGAISEIGLHLSDPNLSYERYEALCYYLGRLNEMVRFAIGDTIILGEQLFKERAYQALESLGLSEKGRLEYVRVSEKVPRSVRRKDLSWSHHRAVASLEPPKQREWLKKAAAEQMSHAELRDALRGGEEPVHSSVCRCCHRPLEE
jgi:hypothetical protein